MVCYSALKDNPMSTVVLPKMDRVVLSTDAKQSLLEHVQHLGGQRVFLIASATLQNETPIIAEIIEALGSLFAGSYVGIPPHVPADSVIDCASRAREAQADLIVTIGGGSVTDAGKVTALCMQHAIQTPAQFEPFYNTLDANGNRQEPTFVPPSVRVICIPTTLSGGEFNYRSGVTDPTLALKRIIGNPVMIPTAVILSASVSSHTPPALFLSTGVRALDHAVETLCSVDANPYTDAMAIQAIQMLREGLQRINVDPTDSQARLNCHVGAWLSMTGVVGRLRMGASHAIGHVLGGSAGMPHGYTSCVMLPAVLRYNENSLGENSRRISEALGNVQANPADLVAELVKSLGLPSRLRDCGVRRESLPDLARKSMSESWIYSNPRPIKDWDDVLGILQAAY
jgi:maleylacetate reductase